MIAACADCGRLLGGWYREGTRCGECASRRRERQAAELVSRDCADCGEQFEPSQAT